jgi:RNA recognition motif. (a.k.a. RRM, RBD, or RNP domain)
MLKWYLDDGNGGNTFLRYGSTPGPAPGNATWSSNSAVPSSWSSSPHWFAAASFTTTCTATLHSSTCSGTAKTCRYILSRPLITYMFPGIRGNTQEGCCTDHLLVAGLPTPRPLAVPANLTSQVQAHLQAKLKPAMPDKSTTLYVGKIALSVEDSVIKSLLEACGPVKSWKPVQDPETQKSKGYGFCEFEEADGVLHALRFLNNLSLDGQELMLKCTTATQKYVDAVQLKKEGEAKAKKLEKKEKEKKAIEDGEVEQPAEEEQSEEELEEQKILEMIMTIVSARATEQTINKVDSSAAANDFLANLEEDKQLPPPPGRPPGKRPREEAGARPDYERKVEEDFKRERDREREDEEQRMKERERLYRERLHAWEKYERCVTFMKSRIMGYCLRRASYTGSLGISQICFFLPSGFSWYSWGLDNRPSL